MARCPKLFQRLESFPWKIASQLHPNFRCKRTKIGKRFGMGSCLDSIAPGVSLLPDERDITMSWKRRFHRYQMSLIIVDAIASITIIQVVLCPPGWGLIDSVCVCSIDWSIDCGGSIVSTAQGENLSVWEELNSTWLPVQLGRPFMVHRKVFALVCIQVEQLFQLIIYWWLLVHILIPGMFERCAICAHFWVLLWYMPWHLFGSVADYLTFCQDFFTVVVSMKLDRWVSQPNGCEVPYGAIIRSQISLLWRSRSNRTVWTSTALCETPNAMWRNCLPSPCRASARWQRQEGKPVKWCREMGKANSCLVWMGSQVCGR